MVDAARAAGALELGFVCSVLLSRFFGMNPKSRIENPLSDTVPAARNRNTTLGSCAGSCGDE